MTAMRMQFFTIAAILLLGILLTGLTRVHWLLYLLAAMMLIAGITGKCIGLQIWKMLGFKDSVEKKEE